VSESISLPECNFFHSFNNVVVVFRLVKESVLINHLNSRSHLVPSYMLPIGHEADRPLQEFAWLLRNGENCVIISSRGSFDHTKALLNVSCEAFEPSIDLVINLEYRAVTSPGDAGLCD
jgi:hypothetical protein